MEQEKETVARVDMETALPIIREAFDNKSLQMFTHFTPSRWSSCLYTGPCAIGVCIPKEHREYLDCLEEADIGYILRSNTVIAPEDQHDDFVALQEIHDQCLLHATAQQHAYRVKQFEDFLMKLEEQYLTKE